VSGPAGAVDQGEAIAGFASLLGLPPGSAPEIVRTHISLVLLGPSRVLKMKRAVRLPYVDFSTPEKRLAACEAEFALNRRTAPELYLGLRQLTRETDGALALDGEGPLVEAAVEMRRFPQDALLDRVITEGRGTPALVDALAGAVAAFHRGAARHAGTPGGAERMAGVLAINEAGLRAASALVPPDRAERLIAAFRRALAGHAALLDLRAREGAVRRCHGDLILRNICVLDGRPVLFDCLEFDDELATVDVLYDLAFLLMDLWHREHADFANRLFNRYADLEPQGRGLALVPFFMAVRAAVRAHVTAAQAREAEPGGDGPLSREALAYVDLAEVLLEPVPARLVTVAGFSGSGKSTLAAALAPSLGVPPGARILSSDRTRKRLFGVAPQQRLPAEAYRPEVSKAVYDALYREATEALAAGLSVVLDGVFARPEDRRAAEAVAEGAGVPFSGLWLDAPAGDLARRVTARRGDPSDADAAVVEAQLAAGRGDLDWPVLDAGAGADAVLAKARDVLARRAAPA
jgi:aminoglycoside phosphotransferase family enzyme/predicted kinase